MKKSKRKHRLKQVLLSLLILAIPAAFILKGFIKDKIVKEIEHFNSTHPISINYSDLNLSIISGSSTIKEVSIIRDSTMAIDSLSSLPHPHIEIGKLKIKGLSVSSLLLNKKINLNKIIIENLDVVYIEKDKKNNLEEDKETSFDSIRLKGIKGFSLGVFEIDQYKIMMINKVSDTLINLAGDSFEIDGLKLHQIGNTEYFKPNSEDLKIIASNQSILLNTIDYHAALDSFQLFYDQGNLSITNLEFLPLNGAQALADSQKYNDDVVSLKIGQLNMFGLDINDILIEQNVLLDSLRLDRTNIDIFKDKHKPFNFSKRPLLIHQKLRRSKNDINIGKIIITNSTLNYVEKIPDKMNTEVDLTNLNATIINMNNTQTESNVQPMIIDANGTVLKTVPFALNLTFSNVMSSDYFRFKGSTGASKFESFNSVLLPTTGIKFEKGNLNGINFSGGASTTKSEGEMTMLFDNLDAAVLKKDQNAENKTFSFLANAAIKDSNPTKNGKVSIAEIEFERTMYKGFGNYLWKTVESGLVNSVYPFGHRKKVKEKKK